MKKSILFYTMIYENAFSYAIIFVLIAALSYLLQGTFSMVRSNYEVLELADKSGLDEKILISYTVEDIFYGERDFEQIHSGLSETPGVQSYIPVEQFTFWAEDHEQMIQFSLDAITEETYQESQYPLIQGNWPEEPYEVALAENMKKYYREGDQISVLLFWATGNPNNLSIEQSEAELKVVGFIPMDAQIIRLWAPNDDFDLSNMSTTFGAEYESMEIESGDYAVGVVIPPKNVQGEYIGLQPRGTAVLVTPDREIDPNLLREALGNLLPVNQIQSGKELIERYNEKYHEEYEDMSKYTLIVSSLVISSLLSAVFLQLRKKRLEMTVYYMCGITWKQSIGLFCIVYIPIIVLSFLSGTAVFMAFRENHRWFDGKDSWWILLILLAVSFLFILPLYLLARRSSPVEQTRKD